MARRYVLTCFKDKKKAKIGNEKFDEKLEMEG